MFGHSGWLFGPVIDSALFYWLLRLGLDPNNECIYNANSSNKKLVEANQQMAAKQEVGASNKDSRGGQMPESKRSVSIK